MLVFILFLGCNTSHKVTNNKVMIEKNYVKLKHPDWTKNATIYEVNLRQYTPEGTFSAFETHLPRLKKMGVDILWLMPLQPIGLEKRKGTLGSYYSIRDYRSLNPEFGNAAEFTHLINSAHRLGMKVIIDWVANHSSWDNTLVKLHPEWYSKSRSGQFHPTAWYDWDDIIEFDFDNPDFRLYMMETMGWWLKEYNLDGFRCDVAGFVPIDFWEETRAYLDQIKPVFMLAEWESRDLHRNAFDMTYSWSLWEKMKAATSGGKGIGALVEYLAHDVNTFPSDGYRMNFTDNHDKNSWEGNQFSNFGDAFRLCAVTTCVINGMPLVYSGQEAGLDRSLRFFDKDTIQWKDHELSQIYTKLFDLKHQNQALWNGNAGGIMERLKNDHEQDVISFIRVKNGAKVIALLNYSDKKQSVKVKVPDDEGLYFDVFSGDMISISKESLINLEPWGYSILSNIK